MIKQRDARIEYLDSAIGCSKRERQEIIDKRDANSAVKDDEIKQLQDRLAKLERMIAATSDSEESDDTIVTIGDSTSEEGKDGNENSDKNTNETSPTGKVRQMADKGFEALDNAMRWMWMKAHRRSNTQMSLSAMRSMN